MSTATYQITVVPSNVSRSQLSQAGSLQNASRYEAKSFNRNRPKYYRQKAK